MKREIGFKSYGVRLVKHWLREGSVMVMDNIPFGNVSSFLFDLEPSC